MVGSGGTSHQVHCIEHPMKVRKLICAAIGKLKPEATKIPDAPVVPETQEMPEVTATADNQTNQDNA